MMANDETGSYRRRLLQRYQEQAQEVGAWAAALPRADAARAEAAAGWTQHQLLAHVRDAEIQAYAPRLERILAEEDPVFEDFDAEAWMDHRYDRGEAPQAIAAEFAAARARGSARLEALPPEAWNRMGSHPQLGSRTLQWWVERAVAHAQEHLDDHARQSGGDDDV